MNLNFIQDNDQVHVETQNQFAYKQQIILKAQLLKQDFADYRQINPHLITINSLFTQIVKDIYQHATNVKNKQVSMSKKQIGLSLQEDVTIKKKKKISIPYGTVKKLENLKQKFIQCQKIIQLQNDFYRKFNINSENEKKSQVKFYKKILTSYQSERQYYKKYTLKLQDIVQQVETQVKKVSYNQNHPFTDFDSRIITYQSMIKYQKKLAAFQKVNSQLALLDRTKEKIYDHMNIKQNKNKEISSKKRQKIAYAKNYLKSIVQTQKKINILKITKNNLLEEKLIKLYGEVDRIKTINEALKKAILQSEGEKFFLMQEQKISLKNKKTIRKAQKVSKTDYIIYLKQLSSKLKQYFKNKEIVYRYQSNADNRKIKSLRSKSACFQ